MHNTMTAQPYRSRAASLAVQVAVALLPLAACGGGEIAVQWESQTCNDAVAESVTLPTCASDTDCPTSPTACVVGKCLQQAAGSRCAWVMVPDGISCDDGQACSGLDVCKAGKCTGAQDLCACKTHSDCQKLDDGNLCNGGLYCDTSGAKSMCKPDFSTAVTCPTGSDCQPSFCDPKSGKCTVLALDGTQGNPAPCDDGNPCTGGDQCVSGSCTSGKAICECLTDGDCGDDGNLCNGTTYCDKNVFPFACKVNPATVVTCLTGLDTDCVKNLCEPKTGQCFVQLAAEGSQCSDGDSCTGNDFCSAGSCAPGKSVCPCFNQAECGKFEDGDLCNGTLYCDLAATVPGCKVNPATVVDCPKGDDSACQTNQCDKQAGKCGMVAKPAGTVCDDNNLCTASDLCEAGACKSGANTCGCTQDSDCGKHEDGNLCNGTLYCDKSKLPFACAVNPGTVVQCSDGNDTACSVNTCDPKQGQCKMVAKADGLLCDADGFACTKADVCKAGICTAGANVCKCEQNTDCGKNEDGNLCNGTLYCDKTQQPFVCAVNPQTLIVCKTLDDTACLANQCQPKSGVCQLTPIHQGEPCNADGDVCTTGDACHLGVCQAGTNTCQCTADADCAKYDDGNQCNGTLSCDKSATPFLCKPDAKSVVKCPNDGKTPCIKNKCEPKSGQCALTALADGKACNDGDVCTSTDVCTGGKCAGTGVCACTQDSECAAYDDGDLCNGTWGCLPGKAGKSCQPKNDPVVCPKAQAPCYLITCKPTSGQCAGSADLAQDGTACDDKDPCTPDSKCLAGACLGAAKSCDDNNICTVDSCAQGLCVHGPASGAPCSDGNACTSSDLCALGQCVGLPLACTDSNPCTVESCNATKGCVAAVLSNGATCTDGNACTVGDSCVQGNCLGKAGCDDANPCTDDVCTAGACKSVANSVQCDDGSACTDGDGCVAGQCTGTVKPCAAGDCGGGTCDPLIGCANVAGKQCNLYNFCVEPLCLDDLGCVGLPKLDGSPCGSGPSISACNNGTCEACKAVHAVLGAADKTDLAFGGLLSEGAGFWVCGSKGVGDNADGWYAKWSAGGIGISPATVGGTLADHLSGLAQLSSGVLVAAGYTSGQSGLGTQGWLVSIDMATAATKETKAYGGPGEDGFEGVVTADVPIAFGWAADNGWLARIGANLELTTATYQHQGGYEIEWRAATFVPGNPPTLYVAGIATNGPNISAAVVGSYNANTLAKNWLTLTDDAATEANGIAMTANGLTVVGVRYPQAVAKGWIARVGIDGTFESTALEVANGARAYFAVTTGKSTDAFVVGGAELIPMPLADLTAYGWVAQWNLPGNKQQVASSVQTAVPGVHLWRQVQHLGSGYLLAGELSPAGGPRKIWLQQVDSAGKWVCQP